MRLNTRQLFRKNKGFTLIELVVVIAICSIIIAPIYAILSTSSNIFESSKEKDELMLNAKHSIEYIKNEIKSSDLLIADYKINGLRRNYPTNIGFVLVIIEEKKKPGNANEKIRVYRYLSYYTKNGKLIRIACEDERLRYPSQDELKGHNEICRMIDTIENTKLDLENSMVKLDFDFKTSGREEYKFNIKRDVYVRCKIDN